MDEVNIQAQRQAEIKRLTDEKIRQEVGAMSAMAAASENLLRMRKEHLDVEGDRKSNMLSQLAASSNA
eukprot:gene8925-8077_t